ncbi:MAG: aminotransferase class V-fold PLP-dependent enzyme [Gemmatimonadota bacterium]|nr:aminotransferase class V-fold PLP-dependent enzyme [Gemmatimonadota bacterium]
MNTSTRPTLRDRIVGIDCPVPLLDGTEVPYLNLDNAASTPALQDAMDAVERFLPYYASVHRGTGFKSRLSTEAYDRAHRIVATFVGADPEHHAVIFGKNTTEAVNKLSYRLPLPPDPVVITTQLEHHSNDLPWRRCAQVVHVRATPEGRLDEADFDRQLARYGSRVALVTVTGASNVSGFIQPIHRLARKAHAIGTRILVDAAQLAPHRPVAMRPVDDPEHLDFVVLSAHKMYAPFGTGALIGPSAVFLASPPEYRGGGTVDAVTVDDVLWAGLPDREEAGSPNVVGAVAMAAAATALMDVGMDQIAEHENELVMRALHQLPRVPGLVLYGETDPARARDRVGVLPFNVTDVPHALVSAVLGYEGGIGVRHGCFCAHPYVVHLLQLSDADAARWRAQMAAGNKSDMPGMVRASFGCYNTLEDVDRLVEMLHRAARGEYRGTYEKLCSGEYVPAGYTEQFERYFALADDDDGPETQEPRLCGG